MAEKIKYRCDVCGREREARYFWKRRDGSLSNVCVTCMMQDVDIKKPETFIPILKELDRPYIETLWVQIARKQYQKDPDRFNAQKVLGNYIKSMSLMSYRDYGFNDSLKFAEEAKQAHELKRKRQEALEREKKIPNEKNKTEKALTKQVDPAQLGQEVDEVLQEPVAPKPEVEFVDIPQTKRYRPQNNKRLEQRPVQEASLMPHGLIDPELTSIDEQEILNNLTRNEIQELAIKWGENYAPSEWLKMEEMYQRYAQEFELNVDRDEALRNLCKTTIKLNQAIDAGDASTASKFASISDQLRKSGAFTEAQKKEEKKDYVSSIGELVSEVERLGGIIPRFDYKYEVEPDKVDVTLRDNQAYLLNLVKNEMGLGDIIESYIQKLDAAEQNKTTESLGADLNTNYMRDRDEEDEEYANNWLNELEDSIMNDESLENFFEKDDGNGVS